MHLALKNSKEEETLKISTPHPSSLLTKAKEAQFKTITCT